MSDVMIEARDLTKRYGSFEALRNVSFEVRKGEVVGFLGPNGAGKTTTMKILTCFIAPTDGTAKVAGADVWEDPLGVRQAIGYLPESTPLYPEMLVLEYLEFVAKMRRFKGEEAKKRLRKVVEQTQLGDVLGKEIGTLSKGYKQRVGLAQALVHEPPILILDEPMSGLDPNQATGIRDLIKEIGRERTVILSTHNLAEVEVSCGRVLIIAKGTIVADDTPDALRARAGKSRFHVSVLTGENGTRTDADMLKKVFGALPGVERVLDGAGTASEVTVEILPREDDDLRPAIFRAAVDAGLVLVELRREGENLEHVFRHLTSRGPDAPEARTNDESRTEPPAAAEAR